MPMGDSAYHLINYLAQLCSPMHSCGCAAFDRKQKTDRLDAQLLLKLLPENRFPRIWVPNPENRDLRQLLWHRHRLVHMRSRIMNRLQEVAVKGKRWKKKLLSE